MESFPKPVGIQAILDGKQKSQFQSGDIMTRFQKNLFPISRALIQWVMSFQLVWQHVTNQGEVASQIQTNFFFIIVCKMTKMLIFKHKSALINCLPGIPSTLDQTQGKKKKGNTTVSVPKAAMKNTIIFTINTSLPSHYYPGLGPCPFSAVVGTLLGAATISDKVSVGCHFHRLPERLPGFQN